MSGTKSNSIVKLSIEDTDLNGLKKITPFSANDSRGQFVKDYSIEGYIKQGLHYNIKEIFISESKKGVLRGLHFQTIKPQSKIIRCVKGKIFDVAVDLRTDSKTFGQWRSFILEDKGGFGLIVPVGFAHGFLALEDSLVSYECDECFYCPGDSGILWNDPDLAIPWPLDKLGIQIPILSEKDCNLKTLEQYLHSEYLFKI